MRRDAQQNREALILAAAACFGTDGYDIPLEDIADRAGVGRGTLYRNFKDRMDLILAIFAREVDRLDPIVDPALPLVETMARLVKQGAPANVLFARLKNEIAIQGENLKAFQALGTRTEQLLSPAVDAAKARGEIRQDLEARQIFLAIRMAGSLVSPAMTSEEMDTEIGAALALLMAGLRPA